MSIKNAGQNGCFSVDKRLAARQNKVQKNIKNNAKGRKNCCFVVFFGKNCADEGAKNPQK